MHGIENRAGEMKCNTMRGKGRNSSAPCAHHSSWLLLPVREKTLTVPMLLAASSVCAPGRQHTAEMKALSLCWAGRKWGRRQSKDSRMSGRASLTTAPAAAPQHQRTRRQRQRPRP